MKSKSKSKETEPGTNERAWEPAELETAYQIHTLAQLVLRHLASTDPWIGRVPPPLWAPPAFYPPMSAAASPAVPVAWP